MSVEKAIGLFEKQMILEKETAKSFRALASRTKNGIPKLLFMSLELDSMKHARMYATLIDLARRAAVSAVERYDMRKELERHIADEEKMLTQARRIAKGLSNPRMKPLLQAILADERRHHRALSELLKTVAVQEEISQDDWWAFLNKWAVFST
jgi:hypothetical protein